MPEGEYRFEYGQPVKERQEFEILCRDPENNAVGCLNFKLSGYNSIELRNVEVKPDFRRRGLGRELLNYLKQISRREFQATQINALISPLNPRNRDVSLDELIMFFQGNGFVVKPVSSYEAFGTFKFF